jgi:hypothetical protein
LIRIERNPAGRLDEDVIAGPCGIRAKRKRWGKCSHAENEDPVAASSAEGCRAAVLRQAPRVVGRRRHAAAARANAAVSVGLDVSRYAST